MKSLCNHQKELDEAIALDKVREDRGLVGRYPTMMHILIEELEKTHEEIFKLRSQ